MLGDTGYYLSVHREGRDYERIGTFDLGILFIDEITVDLASKPTVDLEIFSNL